MFVCSKMHQCWYLFTLLRDCRQYFNAICILHEIKMAAAGGHALTLSRQIRNFGVCRSILQRSSCKNLGTQRFHLVRSFSQGAYRPISLTTSVKVGGITCAVIGTASFAWLLRKQQTLLADEGWKKHPVSRKVNSRGVMSLLTFSYLFSFSNTVLQMVFWFKFFSLMMSC